MAISEVSSQGWFSRIWESIQGVLVGIVLFLVAFPVLFWGEGRAVHRAKGLAAGKSQVVSVSSDKVDPANEGKLVHMSGMATAEGTLSDPDFGVEAPNALQLQRKVDMFQWQQNEKTEKKKKLGGGQETVTTYTYEKVWSDEVLDSKSYKEPNHDNPSSKAFQSQKWQADDAKVGAFLLGGLTEKVNDWTRVPADKSTKAGLKTSDGMLFSGADPKTPKIGDVRVTFEAVQPAKVSLVAVQKGDSFAPFDSGQGDNGLFDLMMGDQSAEQMFQKLEAENTTLTWILRLVGFVLMAIGISLVFRPLVVVADIVPIFGTLLEGGITFIAFALALPLTLATIAVGWIVYRPLLGIALLAVAGAIVFFAVKTARSRKAG